MELGNGQNRLLEKEIERIRKQNRETKRVIALIAERVTKIEEKMQMEEELDISLRASAILIE